MTIEGAQRALDRAATHLGRAFSVDGPALLRERAELLGIAPAGRVSAGGTCRLLPAGDGRWVALNLARRADVELLAAWMGREWDGPVWEAVAGALAGTTADAAVERAQLLGIPAAVAVAPEGVTPVAPSAPAASAPAAGTCADLRGTWVLDLSALWAGPLCGRLLAGAGAQVVKVEDTGRPDGARFGPPELFTRLNGAKEQVALDLGSPEGRDALHGRVRDARVIVTACRPRALDGLGLRPDEHARRGGIWVSITGYGLAGPWRDRVAFGDDAAVAGGLAVAAGGANAPVFVADAVADPLAGMTAAAHAARMLAAGHAGVVDVAMRDVVATALNDHRYAATNQEVA